MDLGPPNKHACARAAARHWNRHKPRFIEGRPAPREPVRGRRIGDAGRGEWEPAVATAYFEDFGSDGFASDSFPLRRDYRGVMSESIEQRVVSFSSPPNTVTYSANRFVVTTVNGARSDR